MENMGWDRPDFCLVSGDAYVDHPSFGAAVIARVLEAEGFRVAILAQPDWKTPEAFKEFGRPKYGFLVTAGNLDSMVNHYTSSKKKRAKDAYSPGGQTGLRPDRATIVYCNKIREAYSRMPIIIGGVEASLRRFSHYDYWADKVRRSILIDSGADILVYGMGEAPIIAIANAMRSSVRIKDIDSIPGTSVLSETAPDNALMLPSFDEISADKRAYARMHATFEREQDPVRGKRLAQKNGALYAVQNPPAMPLSRERLDAVYSLPYQRAPHPSYTKPIPALEEVEFSITSNRGCFGSCAFCSLTFHQGRIVSSRSHESILAEAKAMTASQNFKGYIHDVGGPTANFRRPACQKQLKSGACADRECLFPKVCPNMDVSHKDYMSLLAKLSALPGVKKVFIRSGLRMDYLMADKDKSVLKTICEHHVSGQLKIAPEHISEGVLYHMRKPSREVFERFLQRYRDINQKLGKEQYCVPYLMSSHPGSDLNAAIELALYLKQKNLRVEQVQDFYPTPGTRSTCIFYTGLDPDTLKPVYVPRTYDEKAMQRALLQPHRRENRPLVVKALRLAERDDLIGALAGGNGERAFRERAFFEKYPSGAREPLTGKAAQKSRIPDKNSRVKKTKSKQKGRKTL